MQSSLHVKSRSVHFLQVVMQSSLHVLSVSPLCHWVCVTVTERHEGASVREVLRAVSEAVSDRAISKHWTDSMSKHWSDSASVRSP